MKASFLITLFLFSSAARGQAASGQALPTTGPRGEAADQFMTPLMRAAEIGRLDEVRRLLKAGADVNEKLEGLGLSALMLAAARGHKDVAKVLLEAGADPNAAGGMGHPIIFFSPLTMAMNRQNKSRLEMVDLLIAAGAKLTPPTWHYESPLDAAVRDRDIEMMKALLERGADVNWQNEIGRTPLVNAISDGERDVKIIELLLKAGADPNKPRLWVGDDCYSILATLDQGPKVHKDRAAVSIIRLLKRYGAKKYRTSAHGEPCKS